MSLKAVRAIELPDSANLFDHGAFDPKSRPFSWRTRAGTASR